MLKQIKLIRNTIYLCTLSICLYNCKTSIEPVKIDTTPIAVSLDLVNVINDKVKVEVKTANITSDTISYFLPKIVPGTYQNNNYGKFIDNFEAFDANGNPLLVQKFGDNRWKINNAQQLKKITYWVNDTFDTEDTHDIFSPTGSNIKRDKNFVLNLYAFVGYFRGMKEKKYNLFIKHPLALEASTSLSKVILDESNQNLRYEVDLFSFKRYAEVADSPIMYSIPNKVIFSVNGIEVLLSVYSPSGTYRAAQLMPEMERMIRAQKNFLGTINSTKKYSVLLYLASSKQQDAEGFGALEHNTSTVVVLPESIPLKTLNESLKNIVSHEFFHIITPLSIHSEEIHNFNYNNPKMSRHLWLYEGTTEYFSVLFQINQGLISKEEFFEQILEKTNTAKLYDDHIPFTKMSQNILKEPYHSNYRNVYEKGALISMCIDLIIREKTEGALGLIDLVQELSQEFGNDTPFEDDKLFEIIKKLEYPEVSSFLEKYVETNTPIPYDYFLNKAGITYGTTKTAASYFIYEQEPYIKGEETTNEVVFTQDCSHNNFLRKIGIKGGDVLLAINDKKYSLKNIYDLFSDSKKWKNGQDITFVIKRNNEIITLESIVTPPSIEKATIKAISNPTEKQIKVLKGWINE
ncbi:peptidase M61 [Aquimarina hainanensis]|uniref:Peptidase M61 n=1 Tax=Aquimarina hainanensis TaxID=1578017 RepID=A0ABW5N7R0_9FLAO|nr:peptidase M61 [Aquimarina sp. TRL1]QKX05664.1 peptidase M61 [Aquimarina sp. TRL1]